MSGLEIAGVALAILPILISAAEHYTTITRPISRFSKFSPEVNRYRTQLNTHSTIFRAECQLLLGHVVRDGEATKMLKSSSHPLWQDPDVNGALEKLLGDSKEALINTVSMINSILRTIEQELQSLSTIASSEKPREVYFTYLIFYLYEYCTEHFLCVAFTHIFCRSSFARRLNIYFANI